MPRGGRRLNPLGAASAETIRGTRPHAYPDVVDKSDQLGPGGGAARRYGAEFLGTALLVFAGVGSAIFALDSGGIIVVALSFGLVLLALSYALGPVSGAHLNPAVTLGALLSRSISPGGAVGYWIAQVLGGILAAFVLFGLVRWGGVPDETAVLGANEYGARINTGGAMVLEFLLTFLFVLVVLLVTGRTAQTNIHGTAIGLALGLANLVAIRLDGASINPARSVGPALFQGGTPLRQVWLFIVFPLLGGAAAALVARVFGGQRPAPGPAVDWRAMNLRTPGGRQATVTARDPGASPAAGERAGPRGNGTSAGRPATTKPKRR